MTVAGSAGSPTTGSPLLARTGKAVVRVPPQQARSQPAASSAPAAELMARTELSAGAAAEADAPRACSPVPMPVSVEPSTASVVLVAVTDPARSTRPAESVSGTATGWTSVGSVTITLVPSWSAETCTEASTRGVVRLWRVSWLLVLTGSRSPDRDEKTVTVTPTWEEGGESVPLRWESQSLGGVTTWGGEASESSWVVVTVTKPVPSPVPTWTWRKKGPVAGSHAQRVGGAGDVAGPAGRGQGPVAAAAAGHRRRGRAEVLVVAVEEVDVLAADVVGDVEGQVAQPLHLRLREVAGLAGALGDRVGLDPDDERRQHEADQQHQDAQRDHDLDEAEAAVAGFGVFAGLLAGVVSGS